MKFLFSMAAALLLLPPLTFAQSNYKPGYVLTLKGDTILGEINQKEWFGNPRSIEFRNPAASKTYTVDDISAFGINNSLSYQRYAGPISMDETNTARLSTGIDTSKKPDVVFLKVVQKGINVTLYSHVDDLKTRFFIADNKSGKVTELVYRIYFLPDHGVQTRIENVYISQLYDFAIQYNPTSAGLKRDIETSAYNYPDLKKISQKINNITIDKKKYGDASSWQLFAGLGVNATSFKRSGTFAFYNLQNSSSVFPVLALGVNAIPNPSVGKLIIRGEIQVTGASFKGTPYIYAAEPASTTDFKIDQFLIIINPQVIYNIYNTKAFKFYIDGGISYTLVKNSGNSVYNRKLDLTQYNYLYLAQNMISVPVKLGIVLNKKIDIWASYSTPTDITDNTKYSIDATSIKAGINYQF